MQFTRETRRLIELALKEDLGKGDVTSRIIVNAKTRATAVIFAREFGILAGLDVAEHVFRRLDKRMVFKKLARDGSKIFPGQRIAALSGSARAVLSAERTALNFLQHLSGVATLTSQFVRKTKGTKLHICDTRKTLPGLRQLEKYAVKMGGGKNHRQGLYDQILIKNNHVALAGSLKKAVAKAGVGNQNKLPVEVETRNLSQVKTALDSGIDRIMLDNFSPKEIRQAVQRIRKISKNRRKVIIEASGKVNLANVSRIARSGVDVISVGRLTHSAPALDFNLRIVSSHDSARD